MRLQNKLVKYLKKFYFIQKLVIKIMVNHNLIESINQLFFILTLFLYEENNFDVKMRLCARYLAVISLTRDATHYS